MANNMFTEGRPSIVTHQPSITRANLGWGEVREGLRLSTYQIHHRDLIPMGQLQEENLTRLGHGCCDPKKQLVQILFGLGVAHTLSGIYYWHHLARCPIPFAKMKGASHI